MNDNNHNVEKAKLVVRRGRKAAGLHQEDSRVATMQMEAYREKVFQYYRVDYVGDGGCDG